MVTIISTPIVDYIDHLGVHLNFQNKTKPRNFIFHLFFIILSRLRCHPREPTAEHLIGTRRSKQSVNFRQLWGSDFTARFTSSRSDKLPPSSRRCVVVLFYAKQELTRTINIQITYWIPSCLDFKTSQNLEYLISYTQ